MSFLVFARQSEGTEVSVRREILCNIISQTDQRLLDEVYIIQNKTSPGVVRTTRVTLTKERGSLNVCRSFGRLAVGLQR